MFDFSFNVRNLIFTFIFKLNMKRAIISIGFYISAGFHTDFISDVPEWSIGPTPRYNETCDSLENAKTCEDRCIYDGDTCFENCSLECNNCLRDFVVCIEGK